MPVAVSTADTKELGGAARQEPAAAFEHARAESLAGPSRSASPPKPSSAAEPPVYGIPTNVVTLCPLSVSDTRPFATVTPEPWTRFLLAEVSQGMSVHGGDPET